MINYWEKNIYKYKYFQQIKINKYDTVSACTYYNTKKAGQVKTEL